MVAPAHHGALGILRGHEPLIAALKHGLVEYVDLENQRHFIAVSGGFLEVSENSVIVLADSADLAHEIDISAAEAELEEARKTLRGEETGMARAEAREALDRAMNRIKAARKV